ncbi:MAG: hydrogenase, partial [Leptospiraceae bacterium]|nr:hydrogenase [Leptospiraceae bacterium]
MSELRNFQNEKKLHWQSYETKSREDLTDLQNQEFYTSPDSLIERMKTGKFDRSTFLKLMGASMAMTTLNCVRKPVEKIIPYVNAPEEVKHGHSLFYSSTCRTCSAGCGVLVRSKDGRPLKLEGNPDHIGSRGGLCASGQVSIFDLYDPERTREPMMLSKGDAKKSDWKSLDEAVKKALTANPGKTRILTSPINSPTAREVLEKFLAANGGGEIVEFSATGAEEAIALASEKSYGRSVVPNYHFDRARVVVSIDADFLGTWISPVEFTKQFAGRRKIKSDTGEINTYYAIESVPTVTGSNADARLAIKPGDQRKAAFALALALAELGAGVPAAVSAYKLDTLCSELGVPKASFQKVAKELWAAKGASLIVAGGVSASTEDAVELQVAVNMLNSILGNDGITVNHASPRAEGVNYTGNLKKLVSELK